MNNTVDLKKNNSITIKKELDWLKKMIELRFENHFLLNGSVKNMPKSPNIFADESLYSKWILDNDLKEFDVSL